MITLKMVAALAARDSRFWADPMTPEADDFFSADETREDRLSSWFGLEPGDSVSVPLFPSVLDESSLVVSALPAAPEETDASRFLVRSADAAWIYEVSDVANSSVETLDNVQTETMARVDPEQTDRVLCEVVGLTTMGPLFRVS